MSQPVHKAGEAGPFVTKISRTNSDRSTAVYTIEGTYTALESMEDDDILSLLPEGCAITTRTLDPEDKGMGKITVRVNFYAETGEGADPFGPIRTTYDIDMEEVTYELINHPKFDTGGRPLLQMWLATDEAVRVQGDKFFYVDKDGEEQEITDNDLKKFCRAYLSGITTFTRYYPVVSKISTYSNPPGLEMSESSFTSGTPLFSAGIGTYDDPDVLLNGYEANHWFKSKDSWHENADRTWNRVEQWTYTPESVNGDHAWIYKSTTASGGGNNNGNNNGGNQT